MIAITYPGVQKGRVSRFLLGPAGSLPYSLYLYGYLNYLHTGRKELKNLWDKFKALPPFKKLLIAMALYFVIFSYFASMRYISGYLGDPDMSIFEQSLYTTAHNGKLLYNTYEERSHFRFRNPDMPREEILKNLATMDGSSHFAVHNSAVFLLLVPLYAISPNLVPMIVFQTLILCLGAWAVFLIAKELMDERTGLFFGLLYLLNFPLHGINYDPFHEFGYLITPLLFSFYFLLKKKFIPFWVMIVIAISCKEDIPFLIGSYGLFMIYLAWKEKKNGKWEGSLFKNPVLLNGIAVCVFSVLWLYASVFVLIPSFRGGSFHLTGERYAEFGSSFGEVAKNIILHPGLVFKTIFKYPKFTFCMEMVAPLAFMSFLCLPALAVSAPNLIINLLSSFSVMYNTGSRYSAPVIPFVFISAILGFSQYVNSSKDEETKRTRYFRFMKVAFFITIVGALFFNPSPFRIGWKVPKITPHRKVCWKVIKEIPKDASLATQVDLFLYTNRREKGYVGYREGVEYILVDIGSDGKIIERNLSTGMAAPQASGIGADLPVTFDYKNKWFSEGADWDLELPRLMKSGEYKIVKQEDGVILLKKADIEK